MKYFSKSSFVASLWFLRLFPCLKECDSESVPGSGSEAAAGSHQTLWMTAVTRPRGRAGGQSGEFTFKLMVVSYS